MTATRTEESGFAATIRSETATDHDGAEQVPFLRALASGTLPRAGYVDLLAQYHHIYEALERAAARWAQDPVLGPIVDQRLERVPALTADLLDLAGPGWASVHPPTPSAARYAARIAEASATAPGFVAHHYTRYLGDLSGGLFLGRVADRTYGLSAEHGGRFARFDQISDPSAFKATYRALLDGLPWSAEERAASLDEIRHAYELNVAVFADLEHHA